MILCQLDLKIGANKYVVQNVSVYNMYKASVNKNAIDKFAFYKTPYCTS